MGVEIKPSLGCNKKDLRSGKGDINYRRDSFKAL
jgi:hypothetical protein